MPSVVFPFFMNFVFFMSFATIVETVANPQRLSTKYVHKVDPLDLLEENIRVTYTKSKS